MNNSEGRDFEGQLLQNYYFSNYLPDTMRDILKVAHENEARKIQVQVRAMVEDLWITQQEASDLLLKK